MVACSHTGPHTDQCFPPPDQTSKIFYYGENKTIWRNGYIDVEVDSNGKVVALWFRCMPLPFKQSKANKQRANEMRDMYKQNKPMNLIAVYGEEVKK